MNRTKIFGLIVFIVFIVTIVALIFSGRNFTITSNKADKVISTATQLLSSGWDIYNGKAEIGTSLIFFNNKVYEFAVNSKGQVYYRNFTTESELYNKGWQSMSGTTYLPLSLAVGDLGSGETLFVSATGRGGEIYIKTLNLSNTWSGWLKTSGKTDVALSSVVFNNELYQFTKGYGINRGYVRSTSDGNFDESSPEETWSLLDGSITSGFSSTVFNGRIYLNVLGTGGKIYFRSTLDGISWGNWNNAGQVSNQASTTYSIPNYIIQTAIDTSGKVFIRSSQNGISWTNWNKLDNGTAYTQIASLQYGYLDPGQDDFVLNFTSNKGKLYVRIVSFINI